VSKQAAAIRLTGERLRRVNATVVMCAEDKQVGAAEPSLADSGLLGSLARGDRHVATPALRPRDLPGSSSILGELATDLATEHGENDPNKRDRVKQAGRKDGN